MIVLVKGFLRETFILSIGFFFPPLPEFCTSFGKLRKKPKELKDPNVV
jgi:hypothetical protein